MNTYKKLLLPFTRIHAPEPSEYNDVAKTFLDKTNSRIVVEYHSHAKYFSDDKYMRDIYVITIERGTRHFSFKFGQSMVKSGIIHAWGKQFSGKEFRHNGLNCVSAQVLEDSKPDFSALQEFKLLERREEPDEYSILACLTKYDVGTFANFCSEFGYDTDSKKAEKTYIAVKEEWKNVQTLWTDEELELLREIQ